MNIQSALTWAYHQLQPTSSSAYLDAEILLGFILNQDKAFIYAHPNQHLPPLILKRFKKIIQQRVNGQPIAYLIGYQEFYNLNFKVNRHTLIPRPETELIVEKVIHQFTNLPTSNKIILIDIGTGSGNIIISILKNLSANIKKQLTMVLASDISRSALKTAQLNARTHQLDKKIKFIQGKLLTPIIQLSKHKQLKFTPHTNIIITANLPYLPINIYQANYSQLKHEPKLALVAKQNGLALYQQLLKQLQRFQPFDPTTKTTFYFEILPIQKQTLKTIILKIFPQAKIEIKKDLNGKTRLFIIHINTLRR